MGVYESADIAHVCGLDQRHVTVGALRGLLRIVERTSTLAGDATRLPIVVLVEAADPAVMIYWNVEVHLVARRAEFCSLRLHEGFQEDTAMRLGIQPDHKVMKRKRHGMFGRRQLMEFGILKLEITLSQ